MALFGTHSIYPRNPVQSRPGRTFMERLTRGAWQVGVLLSLQGRRQMEDLHDCLEAEPFSSYQLAHGVVQQPLAVAYKQPVDLKVIS